ncbi:MAG: hypothetical protein GC181_07380 [Bacteroidetes bacterium]|nr:hypothetical protein [Bacteroidota bacterium]
MHSFLRVDDDIYYVKQKGAELTFAIGKLSLNNNSEEDWVLMPFGKKKFTISSQIIQMKDKHYLMIEMHNTVGVSSDRFIYPMKFVNKSGVVVKKQEFVQDTQVIYNNKKKFYSAVSPQQKYLVVAGLDMERIRITNMVKINFKVYDENMKLKWVGFAEYDDIPGYLLEFHISDDANVYFTYQELLGNKKKGNYFIVKISEGEKPVWKEIKSVKDVMHARFMMLDNGQIAMTGNSNSDGKGVFMLMLDQDLGEVSLDQGSLAENARQSPPQLKSVKDKKGDIIQYDYTSITPEYFLRDPDGAFYFFESFMSKEFGSNPVQYYDTYITKFDKYGTYEWTRIIYRRFDMIHYHAVSPTYFSVFEKGGLTVYYNDHPKNIGAVPEVLYMTDYRTKKISINKIHFDSYGEAVWSQVDDGTVNKNCILSANLVIQNSSGVIYLRTRNNLYLRMAKIE